MSTLKTILFFVCAASLFAQSDQPAQSDQTDQPAEPTYAGPSILSRGSGPGFSSSPFIKFRPFVGVNGVYDDGLNAVSVDSNGKVVNRASEGVELTWGLSGKHSWKGTSLGVSYRGSIRHYTRQSFYDGTDQSMDLQLQHRLSRHLSMQLGAAIGTYSNRFGFYAPSGYYDPLFVQTSGLADFFDNRVIYGQVIGRLIYHKTARLSFSFSGAGYETRRRASALYGSTGELAAADVAYRLTRGVTIGADYAYYHFDFLKIFGASDIHSAGANMAVRLSRDWQLSLHAGAFRAENFLLAVVPVNPVIAAITGQTSGIIASYNVYYSPLASGRLSRSFRIGSCGLGYSRGTTPGNGVFLTSRQDLADVTCSYTGQRYWNFGAGISYYELTALAQSTGKYRSYVVGGGFTRSLARTDLHVVGRIDLLHDLTQYRAFPTRAHYRATLGISYSPGELPLTLW